MAVGKMPEDQMLRHLERGETRSFLEHLCPEDNFFVHCSHLVGPKKELKYTEAFFSKLELVASL